MKFKELLCSIQTNQKIMLEFENGERYYPIYKDLLNYEECEVVGISVESDRFVVLLHYINEN